MPTVEWLFCHKCKETTSQSISTELYVGKSGYKVFVDIKFICVECGRTLYKERKRVELDVGMVRRRI